MNIADENIKQEIKFNASETEILSLLAQRYTCREISVFLGISLQTVYNNIYMIKRLTGIHDRLQLRYYAEERGFETKTSPRRITEALNPIMLITQKPKSDIQ